MQIHLPDRVVDLGSRLVRTADGDVALTEQETALLAYLAARPEVPVGRDELLAQVWGHTVPQVTRCVDTAIRRLRTKIEVDPGQPQHLLKVHAHGYRFVPGVKVPAAPPLAASRTDLPPAPALFGREALLVHLDELLRRAPGAVRLVGPVGVGRRALALAAAHRSGGAFPGGVWRAGSIPPPADSLLLEDSPEPRLVASSAGPSPAETVLVVPPLAPGPARELLLSEARRRGADPDEQDPALDALVEATQGLPLVVGLAAAQLGALAPTTVVEQLSCAPATLYDPDDPGESPLVRAGARALGGLDEPLLELLRGLAVFRTPFSVRDAETLTGRSDVVGALPRLHRAGVLLAVQTGAARSFLLPVPIRAVVGPPPPEVVRDHAAWCASWARRSKGPQRASERVSFDAIEARWAEVEAALASGPELGVLVDLVEALDGYAQARLPMRRHLVLLERLVERAGADEDQQVRLLHLRAEVLRRGGQFDLARRDLSLALEFFERRGPPIERAWTLGALGMVEQSAGENEIALARYREALAQLGSERPRWAVGWRCESAAIERVLGRFAPAEEGARAALAEAHALDDPPAIARCETLLGRLLAEQGRHDESLPRLSSAIAAYRRCRDERSLTAALFAWGQAQLDLDRVGEAQQAFTEGLALAERQELAVLDAQHLSGLGLCGLLTGSRGGVAALLRESAVRHRNVPRRQGAWYPLGWLAVCHALEGSVQSAADALVEARTLLGADPVEIKAELLDLLEALVDLGRARAGKDPALLRRAEATAGTDPPSLRRSIDHRLAMGLLRRELKTSSGARR